MISEHLTANWLQGQRNLFTQFGNVPTVTVTNMKKQNEKEGNSSRQLNNRGSLPSILTFGTHHTENTIHAECGKEEGGPMISLFLIVIIQLKRGGRSSS
jgi:hypothetical protein